MFYQPLVATFCCVLVFLINQGHGAIIRFNEPAVRVVEINDVSTLTDIDVIATVTLTDDDGVTPIADSEVVSFNVNLEFDAVIANDRVMETPSWSITADGINTDFPVTLFVMPEEGIGPLFILVSFKLLATLQPDDGSAVPTTVMERSTVEFRIYNRNAYFPSFLVMNPAALKRKADKDLYIYAVGPQMFEGADVEITLLKDDQVVTGGRTLLLTTSFDTTATDQGVYWKIQRSSKRNEERFGVYELTSLFLTTYSAHTVTAFTDPLSVHLNTNGISTITVYSKTSDPTFLEAPLNFGVRRTSLSGSIRWFKGGNRVNTGPRYTIRRAEDAGLYTLHRHTRRKRAWFTHILVQLSRCPRDEVFVAVAGECFPSDVLPCFCLNGGVCNEAFSPICQCPPCFRGIYCEHRALTDSSFAIAESKDFECGDLPSGNRRCKGYKFCLGGNYGCSCGCGWRGPECDKACRNGFYGADCSQRCNCPGSSCDRFTGACSSSTCPTGFKGFNCQVPTSLPFGDDFISGL